MNSVAADTTGRAAPDVHAAAIARAGAVGELAARLVAIPSDHPAHDERDVVEALAAEAAILGLPPATVYAAQANRPNLLFRLVGDRPGPAVLLNGHVDTKPPGDAALWPRDPHAPHVEDGLLHGLGAADMKGAVAAMLHAASVVHDAGLPRRGELLLAFTADEEAVGALGLAHLVPAAGLHPDVAVIGEPSGITRSFDTLPTGSRGFAGFTLRARGTRVHSALVNALPTRTAIAALALALDRLPQLVDFGGPWAEPFAAGPTLSATSLLAGVAPGIVPDVATATGDVRTVPGQTLESIGAALEDALEAVRGGSGGDLDVAVEMDSHEWPATVIDPDLPVVRALRHATERVVHRTPAIGAFPGASEAYVLDRIGIPCVPAFGPGLLRSAHVPGESVRLDDLAAATAIYTLAIAELLG